MSFLTGNPTKTEDSVPGPFYVKGRFPFVRTGRPDHCWTSQLASEIGFFQRVFAEKPSPSCIVFRI